MTEVIFRVDTSKDWKGTVFALFPHIVETLSGAVRYYQHVGQHSMADYDMCIHFSKPATPAEYDDLKKELESYPYEYKLKVIKKRNYNKYLEAWKNLK